MSDSSLIIDARDTLALLRARHPSLALREQGSLEMGFQHAGTSVVLLVQSPTARPAFAVGTRVSLMYRVAGRLSADATATLRETLSAIARTVADAAPNDVARRLDETPDAAVAEVADRYADAIERGRTSHDLELPPCLDLAQRPVARQALSIPIVTSLPAPCDRCAAARACVVCTRETTAASRPLSPLKHADTTAAALAGVAAVGEAFGRPPSAAAITFLLELSRARSGVLSGPPLPVEISLKRTAGALAPLLRLVDYTPDQTPGDAPRETRLARRNGVVTSLATTMTDPAGTEAIARFSNVLDVATNGTVPLTIGAEIGVFDDALRVQIYAHLEPRNRAAMNDVLSRSLGPCAGADVAVPALTALLDRTGGHVALLSLSPKRGEPWSIKAYLALPLATDDAAAGLRAASLGRWAPFAPTHGLAVVEGSARGVRFRKWDFPATTHFQRSRPLIDAFLADLDTPGRAAAARILDGERFAPWPTWVSLGEGESVLYFIPR